MLSPTTLTMEGISWECRRFLEQLESLSLLSIDLQVVGTLLVPRLLDPERSSWNAEENMLQLNRNFRAPYIRKEPFPTISQPIKRRERGLLNSDDVLPTLFPGRIVLDHLRTNAGRARRRYHRCCRIAVGATNEY